MNRYRLIKSETKIKTKDGFTIRLYKCWWKLGRKNWWGESTAKLRNPEGSHTHSSQQRCRRKAEMKWLHEWDGSPSHNLPSFLIVKSSPLPIIFFLFFYFLTWKKGDPPMATTVSMDSMIKTAPHVESEPKALSSHSNKKSLLLFITSYNLFYK